jgi:uncharacterized membrane protein (DUF106 family)
MSDAWLIQAFKDRKLNRLKKEIEELKLEIEKAKLRKELEGINEPNSRTE